MVRWVRLLQHPSPSLLLRKSAVNIFFFLIINGSVNFLFLLTDVFQVLVGEDLNRTCRKWCLLALLLLVVRRWSRSDGVSVTGSGVSLVCVFGSFYNVHHITNSFFNNSTFPTGRVILIFFKVIFFSRVEPFLGTNVVFRSLFCFESSLSKTDLIFLANIVSAGETASGVLGLGVIMYTCRNCGSALSVGVPDAFLSARFNVSSKRSAW